MRIIIIGLVLFFAASSTAAQDRVKTWIFLTDKIDYDGKQTSIAPDQLSPRALQRMLVRGNPLKAEQIARQDAPVAMRYLTALEELGINIAHVSRWLNAVTAWLTEEEAAQVEALPFVQRTQPVAHLAIMVEPFQPIPLSVARRSSQNCPDAHYGGSCNQLDIANAIPPLERGINGEGVHLGFLDTKFGSSTPFGHLTFAEIRRSGRLGGHEDMTNRDATQPCNQSSLHGQAVASVAAGYTPGILIGPAYGATIWGVVTECAPYERNIEEDNLVVGAEWLTDQGVDIISTSLGYSTFDDGQNSYTISDLDGDTGITTRILDWAAARGVVTVSSAGNSGQDISWPYISTPADGDSVIAAGGVNRTGTYWRASSTGPTADGRIKPDVSAQSSGVYLASGSSNYGAGSGTSFSAPMISGVIAQILQVNPALTPREVWDIVTSTASQGTSPDTLLGWGIINADWAVQVASRRVNVEQDSAPSRHEITVHDPYPNPFANSTRISVDLARPASGAQLAIYNLLGQEIARPWTGHLDAGRHDLEVTARHLSPGLYLYVFKTERNRTSGTMVVVR